MPEKLDISVEDDSQDQPDVETSETGDQTVIVETGGDDGASEVVVETAIDHEGRVTNLENSVTALSEQMTALSAQLESATFRQEMTEESISDLAANAEATNAALAETIQEDLPELAEDSDSETEETILGDDKPPTDAREHWWFARNPFKR